MMKQKTDLYTKIVLTVIAIALVANVLKDFNFVTKAHANELDLSGLTIEQSTDAETTLFIYENSAIETPIKGYNSGYINTSYDSPKYIITNTTGRISR